ncbi:MAG TPA: aspartyl protease family protein [Thermoanaerobaculia bacterium]|nr:aspartyl protease family protein [Thermoanaerobaculia bacterium]
MNRPLFRIAKHALLAAVLAACALYNDVSISPLIVQPQQIEKGSDIQSMIRRSDYLRAMQLASTIDTKPRRSAVELQSLGQAELAAGRFDAARRHLRAALDLDPFRTAWATIAWDLAQVEYLSNNCDASLEWAQQASSHGLAIKQWHLEYLSSLSNKEIYRFSGLPSDRLSMRVGRPDVPRIDVRVNRSKMIPAVVDSGAVLSIISHRVADSMPVHRLGDFKGTFYGLLGEPITVEFGLLDSIAIGDIVVENVPVAIMPNEKMRFLVSDKKEFNIDFLLGAHLLKEFRLDFDFRHKLVTFTRLTSADRRPADDQNLFLDGFRPLVRGTVNGHGWYVFVFDTGSEVTFLNETQMPTIPGERQMPKIHSAMLQGLGGAKKRGTKVENVSIGIDKWSGTFRTLPMYASSDQERGSGIIGENFLENFRVILDFGRMRVDLIRDH